MDKDNSFKENIRVSSHTTISMDGYLSRGNGDTSWLGPIYAKQNQDNDYGWQAYFETIDCLLLGRKSYEDAGEGLWETYKGKLLIVMSTRMTTEAPHVDQVFDGKDCKALLRDLWGKGIKHIKVAGGTAIQHFVSQDCMGEMIIATAPLLLGQGRRLFEKSLPVIDETPWETHSEYFQDSGIVQTTHKKPLDLKRP